MTKLRVGKGSSVPDLPLLDDIRGLIETARQRAATAVNTELTLLYWRIGQRIQSDVLVDKRADYGEAIVATLSRQLVQHYLTAPPPRELLAERLPEATARAQRQIEHRAAPASPQQD